MEIQVSLIIPDELLSGASEKVSRQILEQFVLEGYKKRKLTTKQVGELLGFSTRFEVDDFLHRHEAFDYSVEDLEADLKTLKDLGLK